MEAENAGTCRAHEEKQERHVTLVGKLHRKRTLEKTGGTTILKWISWKQTVRLHSGSDRLKIRPRFWIL